MTGLHRWASRIALALAAAVAAGCAAARPGAAVPSTNAPGGLALHGYDPVAYFARGAPRRGLPEHSIDREGASYRFASAENAAAFAADPERYLPRYGGYCAYAMSLNRIADVDPEQWAIVDGALYLNNNALAHALWSIDRAAGIAAADGFWAAYPKSQPASAGSRVDDTAGEAAP